MEHIEACMGGQVPDYMFNLEEYERRCLQVGQGVAQAAHL
jgi:hypothetical protein